MKDEWIEKEIGDLMLDDTLRPAWVSPCSADNDFNG